MVLPLLYNLMLADQVRWKAGVARYLNDLAEWANTASRNRTLTWTTTPERRCLRS
jgi:glutaredoxin 2